MTQQIPGIDIAAIRQASLVSVSDGEEPQFDQPAYLAQLRNRLETARNIGEPELLQLANARADAVLSFLEASSIDTSTASTAEPRAVEPQESGSVPMELGVSSGQ